MGDHADFYYKIIQSQRGGDFPVFRGARHIQYGNGFGDIFRGIFRHVLPVLAKGAATFFGDLVRNREQGSNWGSALKSAIAPTAMSVIGEASKHVNQTGTGKKRKRRNKRTKKAKKQKVYKEGKRKSKKRKINFKSISAKSPKFNF